VKNRVELTGRLNLDPNTQALNAPELKVAVGPLKANASIQASQLFAAPKFSGRLELPSFDARPLLQQLGVAYAPADANVLKRVGLATKFNATTQSAALSEINITLDDTKLSGNLALQKFSPPAPTFDLTIDNIDVDRYLPAAEKSKDDKAAKDNKDKAGAAVIVPLARLRDADAKGVLKVQKLKAFGIRSDAIVLQVAAKNGQISLGPNQAKLYGGSYNGRTTIDANAKPPRFTFDEKLSAVQLGPFLKDAQLFDRFSGIGNVTIALTAAGLNADAIKASLNGKAAADIKDGAIEGIDLAKIYDQVKSATNQPGGALNLVKAIPQLSPQKGDRTPFTKLQASATVTNGVAANRDLAIEGPGLRVSGSGNVNLAASRFERYVLRINDLPCALVFDGPFGGLPKADCSDLIKGQTEKAKDKALDRLGDQLRKRLQR